MTLGLNRRRINVKGGGTLSFREIDPTPGSFAAIGFIKDDTFFDEYGMVESIDSKGDFIDIKPGSRHAYWRTTLMQTAKEEIDVMKDAEGKYYEVYYLVPLNNGDFQEILFPVVRIKPGFELPFAAATERNITLELHALAPATLLVRDPVSYNTAIWEPYVMQENAAAVGVPVDAGSVPQAAI